jgi:hypothetical protein
VLTGADANGFQDALSSRAYVVAGPGTLQTPQAVAHAPVNLTTGGAQALYIAPQQFHVTLQPLLALRQAQGYQTAVVDVQAIYDSWSFGHVSPVAIRNFLRYAAANWSPKPVSVVLVGDGTYDPYQYENQSANNINVIPPYLLEVDPWIGETACDNCYVQLDGDDPLTGDDVQGRVFSTDMWIGRFPVRSTAELTGVVDKIVRYENSSTLESWRGLALFLADNYVTGIKPDTTPEYDPAGDFAELSELTVRRMAAGATAKRLYYDPYPNITDPTGQQPWRIADADQLWQATLANMSAGVGLVTFNGHSNHWRWAITDDGKEHSFFMNLFDPDSLTNRDRLFIGLSMTCLSSQFQKAASSGTTLDERTFLVPNGGAVAVWGPTGLSVAHGHDALQKGFHAALWQAPPMTARLGELTTAGYTELLTNSGCCQDVLQTFVLFGDPLTHALVRPVYSLYMPLVHR